jgi:hypothetical protein
MTRCMVYNTTGEPVELVSTLMGLRLHLLGKAVVLETIPDRVVRSARLVFPLPASVVLRTHPAERGDGVQQLQSPQERPPRTRGGTHAAHGALGADPRAPDDPPPGRVRHGGLMMG